MQTHEIICGIIMPISGTDSYSADHWANVKTILMETVSSIQEYKFIVKPVWQDDVVNIIQKSIINNIYQADIVVCDVSSMNPNVMFELGLRLAFDKPTIIIIDNDTKFIFDTGIIEHLVYDRDLNWLSIKKLQKEIQTKIIATLKEKEINKDYSPFLNNFGTFHTSSLHSKDIDSADQLVDMLSDIQNDLTLLRRKHSINASLLRVDSEYIEFLFRKAINFWCQRNKTKADPVLLNDPKFVKWIDGEISASKFFDTPDEFRDTLSVVLSKHNGAI